MSDRVAWRICHSHFYRKAPLKFNNLVRQGVNGESRKGFDTCFLRDVFAVADNSMNANVQFVSNFLIQQALDHKPQNVEFAVGERL